MNNSNKDNMNDQTDQNLANAYQQRKENFKAPKSALFKAKKEKPFWQSMQFYSAICAFSLALVVVLPMLDGEIQSDLIIEKSAQSPANDIEQSPQEMLHRLDERKQFSAKSLATEPAMTKPASQPAQALSQQELLIMDEVMEEASFEMFDDASVELSADSIEADAILSEPTLEKEAIINQIQTTSVHQRAKKLQDPCAEQKLLAKQREENSELNSESGLSQQDTSTIKNIASNNIDCP